MSDVDLLRALVADPTANAVQVLRALGVNQGDLTTALEARHEKAVNVKQ